MGVSSSLLQPQELITFKKLPTNVPLDNIEIPERPENRRGTNIKWLIIFIVFVVALLPFLIYTLYYSDMNRWIKGYDKCGNICGQKNYKWDNIACSGQNWTYLPYLQFDSSYLPSDEKEPSELFQERSCVQSCRDGYAPLFGRCRKLSTRVIDINDDSVRKDKFDDASIDLSVYFDNVKWQIVISCLLSILVAMGMLFLFRYAIAFVVWGIMIGCFIGFLILVAACWYLYIKAPGGNKEAEDAKRAILIFAGTMTIITLCLGLVLIWFRKKIRLVILLLKEATTAVFQMPGLITIPLICSISIVTLTILFLITTVFMATAGTLKLSRNDFYTYESNPVMIFTMAYNFVIYLWVTQFFTGIQYMIIAGATAKWYFSRDKSYLGSPILTSTSIAFRFHLGTVALGSFLITLVALIKQIILGLIKNEKIKVFVESCINAIESFFKFLSKNAYIITAMHGQAFLRSGKRAAKLIMQNISDIIAVNSIGDFVLGMAKFLVMIISILLSVAVFTIAPGPDPNTSHMVSYFIVAVISLIAACVTFGVFETTIDTIFVCYCEDQLLNDGMARPYYMSRNLMEFVQDSKEVYGKK